MICSLFEFNFQLLTFINTSLNLYLHKHEQFCWKPINTINRPLYITPLIYQTF